MVHIDGRDSDIVVPVQKSNGICDAHINMAVNSIQMHSHTDREFIPWIFRRMSFFGGFEERLTSAIQGKRWTIG